MKLSFWFTFIFATVFAAMGDEIAFYNALHGNFPLKSLVLGIPAHAFLPVLFLLADCERRRK